MNDIPLWKDDVSFTLADTDFFITHSPEKLKQLETTDRQFILGKTRDLVDKTVALRDSDKIEYIVDLGIYKGGSVALNALLFKPLKLVGIEYMKEPVQPLENFIINRNLQQQVINYYGINQADSKRLKQIIDREFAGTPIDLVVDDASHQYVETRASFETLFPMLRPGGIYIVEDWGWAHWAGDEWQQGKHFSLRSPSLTNLSIELSMLCASRPDLLESVHIEHSMIVIRRGNGVFEGGDFKLERLYLNRGKKFKAIM
jgi:predicted O-methyltransferase YrrM